MPKFSVLGRFDSDRIPAVVPPDYRGVVRAVTQPGLMYTVLLFAHDRSRGVTTSAPVRRALSDVAIAEPVLAVGANFTQEALALLEERGAAIARLGEYYWTDASYQAIR